MVDYSRLICQSKTHPTSGITMTAAPVEPGLRICRDCLMGTRRRLTSIPPIYSELEHKLTTPSRQPPHLAPTRTAANRGNSVDVELVDTRAAISDILWSWSRLVADERNITLKSSLHRGLKHLVRFLMTHLSWLAAHEAAPVFVDEIHELVATAHVQQEKTLTNAMGAHTCVVPGCGTELMAIVDSDDGRSTANIRCANGHLWSVDQWLLLKREAEGKDALKAERPANRLVSTKAAALALGVPEATIRQWARRGKLTRHGSTGRAEYDIDELSKLAERRSAGDSS
jgi:hypothetical protein